jgi:hypothetical protein
VTWEDLPDSVHARIEVLLGGPVASVHTAPGGFSPSSASIVRAAARPGGPERPALFVKAVTAAINPGSDELNRREARVLAALPPEVPAPKLRAVFEDGEWFVLVTEAIEGENPPVPWRPRDLDAALEALWRLQEFATPSPVPDTPALGDTIGGDLRGFDRVARNRPTDLDPWLASRLAELDEAAVRGVAALAGDTLVHADLRADNMVLGRDGELRVVDWPWASHGSRFADAVMLLGSVQDLHGDLQVSARVDAVMQRLGEDPARATDLLTGILGFFVDAARLDADPSMPTVREHRRRSRDRLLPLVRSRWEAEGR